MTALHGLAQPNTSTLNFGDVYQGSSSYAKPIETATNPDNATAGSVTKAAQTAKDKSSGKAASGLEIPTLVIVLVAAFLLVRYY